MLFRSTIDDILIHLERKYSNVISVGTTSTRVIESLYWLGATLLLELDNVDLNNILIPQKLPYYLMSNYNLPTVIESFEKLRDVFSNKGNIVGRTQLFIVPGYDFKVINGLITNFHLPKSTLLLLVSAFIGENLMNKVYHEAIENKYRFLSYGDTSFLLK